MYIKTKCKINDKIEVSKYYSARYGAPGQKREPKRKPTPEEMAKQNLRNKITFLRRTLELNFKGGDLHIVLTCRKEDRPDIEEAPKVIRRFRDAVKREYKKQGWDMKYIITCETGTRGAVHWHVILNNCYSDGVSTWDFVRKHWNRGRPYFTPLDDNREYQRLAEYIVKETSGRIEKSQTVEKLSYMASRNLIRPEVKRERIRAQRWAPHPKPPAGYQIIPESLVNGINPFTGYPFQKYTMVPVQGGGGGSGCKSLHSDIRPRPA